MESTMTLTGYVGHDLELRATKTGVPTVSFRVATTPRVRTDDGWADAATTWTNVVCYRFLAENVARSLAKGDPVIVQGRVRTQAWVDASGVNHEKVVVEAASVGHDLNRGLSGFVRATARTSEAGPPRASVMASIPAAVGLAVPPGAEAEFDDVDFDETAPGETIDTETGEVIKTQELALAC